MSSKKIPDHKLNPPVTADEAVVLGFDLGPVNTAASVIKIRFRNGVPVGFTVLYVGMITNLIDELTVEFQAKALKFKAEVEKIVKYYRPDWVLFERFQQRAMRKGAVDEKVSMMNGIIASSCLNLIPKSQINPVTAAQWKNRFFQFFGRDSLGELYDQHKNYGHMIDSLLIAFYAFDLFEKLSTNRMLNALLLNVTGRFGPAPSRKRSTKKRARSKAAPQTSVKRVAKAAASTISSTKRK